MGFNITNGSVQVPRRTLEEKAIRSRPLCAQSEDLGVQTAWSHPQVLKIISSRQGYVIYRVRVRRGGRKRPVQKGCVYGKPRNSGRLRKIKKPRTHKSIGEERVGRKCSNLRVLSSYWVGQDASYKFYEVILVDPSHKAIRNDPRINWIVSGKHKKRELRGLTTTGNKSRGMNQRGHKANKLRPSIRGNWKRRNTEKYWRYRRH